MKRLWLLFVIVLLMGCTSNNTSSQSSSSHSNSQTSSSEVLVVTPKIIKSVSQDVSGSVGFTFKANKDVSNIQFELYNLGNYLDSPCVLLQNLGSISKGRSLTKTCSVRLVDMPLKEFTQTLRYEVKYLLDDTYTLQIPFTVYDSSEFNSEHPSTSGASERFDYGFLKLTSKNVEEGKTVNLTVSFNGDLDLNSGCNCNIKKALLKLPRGLNILNYDSNWYKYSCGDFTCLELDNIQTPIESSFFLRVPGVSRTNTFYVGLETSGFWKAEKGKVSVNVKLAK